MIPVPRREQGVLSTQPLPNFRHTAEEFQSPNPVDLGPFTRELADVFQRERAKANQVAVLDADNQLSELSIGLQSEALQRQGKDALEALPKAQDQWKEKSSAIEGSLSNDEQRLAFRRMAIGRWDSLHETITRHTDAEMQKYDASETEAFLTNRLNDAIEGRMPAAEAIEETRAAVADFGGRHGVPPKAIQAQTADRVSKIHIGLMEGMVARGEDLAASKYYVAHKDEVRGEDRAQVERALEASSTEGEGMRAANTVWATLGPKSLNDPIKIADMEQQIRDKYPDNPKVIKAAIQELRSRTDAHNRQQVEVTAANKAAILGDFANGASLAQLVRRREYLTLSGTEQEQLKSYMLNRDYELDLRSDAAKAKRGFAAYWDYSEPMKLASMSDNQILALEPKLGRTLVDKLMTQKRSIDKKDGLLPATIDDDLFKTVADDAGLHPYDPKLDETARASLGRLKNMTEAEISRAQKATGKALTREEKAEVMRSVIDQHVMLDVFGRDADRVASTVSKNERGDAYIPLVQIPPQIRTQAINWMRSNGLILPNESDRLAISRFQRRIEKAYAARIIGATAEEIDQILRGQR